MKRVVLVSTIVMAIIGAAAGAEVAIAGMRRSPPVDSAATTVGVARVRKFTAQTIATGDVRLIPGARVEVGARVSGVVRTLAVTQGSHLVRGQIIAQLDTAEAVARLRQAQAQFDELEAAAAQATRRLTSDSTLAASGGLTNQEFLDAGAAVAQADARAAAAAANRDLTQIQLSYTTIRAPISGVVASVTTHEGETVAASLAAPTFVTLIDPARLECVALVDESDIGHVAVHDSVRFTVDAWPGREFRGLVTRIAPDASVIGGVVDYEVTVHVLSGLAVLKPQMTASVTVFAPPRTALVVPSAAVREAPDGAYVWLRRQGAVHRVAVQPGAVEGDATAITSGLSPGDSVLLRGFPDGG